MLFYYGVNGLNFGGRSRLLIESDSEIGQEAEVPSAERFTWSNSK